MMRKTGDVIISILLVLSLAYWTAMLTTAIGLCYVGLGILWIIEKAQGALRRAALA